MANALSASAIQVNWSENFEGSWFLTNFLRNEGVDEAVVKQIDTEVNGIYEGYRVRQNEGRPFQPRILVHRGITAFVATIEVYHPKAGKEEFVGSVDICFHDDGTHTVIPF